MARVPAPAAFVALSAAAVNSEFKAGIAPSGDWSSETTATGTVCPPRMTGGASVRRSSRRIRLPSSRSGPSSPRCRGRKRRGHAPAGWSARRLAKLGDDRKLGSMMVIPATVFAAQDKIPRRSCKDEGPTPQLMPRRFAELPEGARVIFFSQRWLT